MVAKFAITGIIALIIVVAIIVFIKKFEIGKLFSDSFQGFAGFLNDLKIEPKTDKQKAFEKNAEETRIAEKERQAEEAGFSNVDDFERETDPNSIFNIPKTDFNKFNPKGSIAFGIKEINQGKGIPDTPENRTVLDKFLRDKELQQRQKDNSKKNIFGITPVFSDDGKINEDADVFGFFKNLFNIPTAQAQEPEQITVINATGLESRPLSLTNFANKKSNLRTTNKSNTTVKGISKSELGTEQTFQTFGRNASNSVVKGVIRKTKQDPRKLKTNSKKRPTETASERASRVFEETGKFAGEGRGFGITKAVTKTKNFKFGTNKGSALKFPTTNRRGSSVSSNLSARERLEERKRLQNEKSKQVFDSGSINNF